jgi:hypothetical protein
MTQRLAVAAADVEWTFMTGCRRLAPGAPAVAWFVPQAAGFEQHPDGAVARSQQNVMKPTQTTWRHTLNWRQPLLLTVVLAWFVNAPAADLHLPMLQTKTVTYKNVTVTGKSATDIYITHSLGMGNVKVSSIEDDDALRALGFKVQTRDAERSVAAFSGFNSISSATIKTQLHQATQPYLEKFPALATFRPDPNILGLAVGIAAVCYLAFCFCLRLICLKAGQAPGALIWFPLLQTIPMFRAARMSAGWLLACLIPGLNLVAQILWSFKIVKARGKSAWVAVALLLPVTALFAFFYLAFSRAVNDRADAPIKLGSGPLVFAET